MGTTQLGMGLYAHRGSAEMDAWSTASCCDKPVEAREVSCSWALFIAQANDAAEGLGPGYGSPIRYLLHAN